MANSEALSQPVSQQPSLKTPEANAFMSNIRQKFPMYSDIPDEQLLMHVVKKYPAYTDIANKEFGSVKELNTYGGMYDPFASKNPLTALLTPTKGALRPNPVADAQDLVGRTLGTTESMATSQPKSEQILGGGLLKTVQNGKRVMSEPKRFEAGSVEANALNELGVKGKAQEVIGGLLGSALDAGPMIIGEGAGIAKMKYTRAQGVAIDSLKESLAREFESSGMNKEQAAQQAATTVSKHFSNGSVMDRTPMRIKSLTRQLDENEGAFGRVVKSKIAEANRPVYTTNKPPAGPEPLQIGQEQAPSTQATQPTPYDSKPNQRGSVNTAVLSQLPSQVATNVGQYLSNTSNALKLSGNLEHNLNTLVTDHEADIIEARKLINSSKMTPQDAEAIHNYSDSITSGTTPTPVTPYQKAMFHAISPVMAETEQLHAALKGYGVPVGNDITYTPHIALDKGSLIDKLNNIGQMGSGTGNLLSKSASSLKRRTMYAITDEQGNRSVANIEGGQVGQIQNGVRTELGKLDLQKNIDLLKEEIGPIQEKLASMKKQVDAISSINTRSPLPESRINLLHERIADTQKEIGIQLTHFGNKTIPNAQKKTLNNAFLELKAYSRVKLPEEVILRGQRIATMLQKIDNLEKAINDTVSKYDIAKLDDKVFVDNSGKKWSISNATTSEIEANSNLRYSKNFLANTILTNLQIKRAYKAAQLLEAFKNSPDFAKVALKDGTQNPIPSWRYTQMPQFRGYTFEPKTADVLDNFYHQMQGGGDPAKIIGAINNLFLRNLFLNPLTATYHVWNEFGHWFGDRGLTEWVPMHGSYHTLASTSNKALLEVTNLGPVYTAILRHGGNLLYSRTQEPLMTQLARKSGIDLTKNPTLANIMARNIGLKTADMLKAIYTASPKIMWFANDVFTVQRVLERMESGLSMEEAIEETSKHIPNQIIPTHVLGSRTLSRIISSPNTFNFMRYHYGMMRDWANLVKDASNGLISNIKKLPEPARAKAYKDGMEAVNGMAAIALLYFAITQYKKAAVAITNNPNAYGRYFGPTAIPRAIAKMASGEKTPQEAATTVFTPAMGTMTALELAQNRDSFTNKKIYDMENFFQDTGAFVGKKLSTNEVQLLQGKKTPLNYAAGFAAINSPKHSDAENKLWPLLFDRDTRNSVTKTAERYLASDKEVLAQKVIDRHNDKIAHFYALSLKDKGLKVPSRTDMDEKLSKYYLKMPKEKAIQRYKDRQLTGDTRLSDLENQ